jgi:hypothetical protein
MNNHQIINSLLFLKHLISANILVIFYLNQILYNVKLLREFFFFMYKLYNYLFIYNNNKTTYKKITVYLIFIYITF